MLQYVNCSIVFERSTPVLLHVQSVLKYPLCIADPVDKSGDCCPMKTEIKSLVYWHKPLHSAVVLIVLLAVQFSFLCFSAISIVAYSGFLLLVSVNLCRLYYHYIAKTENKLINRLIRDIVLPKERIADATHRLTNHANDFLVQARDIFLLTNVGVSLKFGVLLYVLTYVGAFFNFLTLCIVATLLVFFVPKFYESYQSEIDRLCKATKEMTNKVMSQISAQLDKLPVLGSRKQKAQ
ncbi:hypothetical protein P879_10035 [Paragonimus westermani]|uniref:Reticulon-like protein n=1 Tax=Paragonimus westermani TaxID=34504 RepID=A0A8T0D2A0_9TREM|nr:hypothetical protein P879_10035 [Paragonimus westermani]